MKRRDVRAIEMAQDDHRPTCPRCGDLLNIGAVFCQACGCYVVVKEKS